MSAGSAAQASHLLENLHTAVLVFGPDLRLRAINSAGEHLLSASGRKMLGLPLSEIVPDHEALTDMLERALKHRRCYTEWGMELRLNLERTAPLDVMVTPATAVDGKPELIVELVNVESLTRARRDEQLAFLHEAARKSLRGVAHEIKNPLGGLRGAAQLLERELDGSSLREYTQIIISEADRLRNLVDRMLVPRGRSQAVELNIHEILEYVLSVQGAEPPVEFERDYDPSLPALQADRDQLVQIFLNLVRNAVQAAGSGGRVTLRTRVKRNCSIRQQQHRLALQVEVIDSGPGVPAEIESEMFFPMVTGRADGVGLGLSIAQALTQAHDGSIEYERDGGQTVFRILLPLD
ncbi:MAG: PAS domain-containing protein [Gammaproteobacteria bacterium]|nr:PAS domain-containing protein [Gammaproteobacteria bacterium]